jgi:hypothetical protein
VTNQIKCAGEKKVRNKKNGGKEWREQNMTKKITQPNLHDISIGKEWQEPKKDKKKRLR